MSEQEFGEKLDRIEATLNGLKGELSDLKASIPKWTDYSMAVMCQRRVVVISSASFLGGSFFLLLVLTCCKCLRPETWLDFAGMSLAVLVWLAAACVIYRLIQAIR